MGVSRVGEKMEEVVEPQKMCERGCRGVTPFSSAAMYQVPWGLRGDFLPSGTVGHSGEDTRFWWMEVWKCGQGGTNVP